MDGQGRKAGAPLGPEEEHLLLRCPEELAERIAARLQDPASAEKDFLKLTFEGDADRGREGVLLVGDDTYAVSLQDLPANIETWKTYNEVDLVKSADIGQVLVVRAAGTPAPSSTECIDGLTPGMKNIRKRHFMPAHGIDSNDLRDAETELTRILSIAHGKPMANRLSSGAGGEDVDIDFVEVWETDSEGED
mmetsp:Transcript_359/g.1183  ORF Transcript_359/g.1183 Transcript_359/m.1183 type:complete len:192 (-) Transcript_359:245-820(-)